MGKFCNLCKDHLTALAEKLAISTVAAGECRVWTKYRNEHGYGQLHTLGRFGPRATVLAHRVAYRLAYGPFDESLCVCHHCDNPPCVNPEHLFLGTQRDNVKDMVAKGRSLIIGTNQSGFNNLHCKLNKDQIVLIRELRVAGSTLKEIGARFGVSKEAIRDVTLGRRWSHVG